MSKTFCASCSDPIHEDEIRWAFDSAYCQDCFDDAYVYCQRCDALLCRGDAHFDEDGDAYCSDCYDEEYDDESPNNPDVHDADREQIVALSRSWLQGKRCLRAPIKVNEWDKHLILLRDKVGIVEYPVYVFGLQDREEYQISASSNILDSVRDFIHLNSLTWKVIEGTGQNRLGLALSIRENALKKAVQLVIHLTMAMTGTTD